MAVSLTQDLREQSAETLTVIESAKHADKVLAVAETGSGQLVLVRERERGKLGDDGKRDKAHGVEKFLKRTSDLGDIRDALLADLIAL